MSTATGDQYNDTTVPTASASSIPATPLPSLPLVSTTSSSSTSSVPPPSTTTIPTTIDSLLPPYLGTNPNTPIIAVDIDECLNSLLEALNTFVNTNYGTNWKIEDYHSYHFVDVWGGTEQEAAKKVTEFFAGNILDNMGPMQHAKNILTKYAQDFRFIVVTSRNLDMAERTRTWISTNYPGCFTGIHFGNHYGTVGKKQTKGEICRSIGAIALIDDNIHYIKEAASSVGLGILFGKYRWNYLNNEEEDTLPINVIRAMNWYHVDTILHRLKDILHSVHSNILLPPSSSSSPSSSITNVLSFETIDTVNQTITKTMVKSTVTISMIDNKDTLETIITRVRKILEIQNTITLTSTGNDTTVLMSVIDRLTTTGDAVTFNMRTTVDSMGPGNSTRIPRLTITLRRTPKFLDYHYVTTVHRRNSNSNVASEGKVNTIEIPVSPSSQTLNHHHPTESNTV